MTASIRRRGSTFAFISLCRCVPFTIMILGSLHGENGKIGAARVILHQTGSRTWPQPASGAITYYEHSGFRNDQSVPSVSVKYEANGASTSPTRWACARCKERARKGGASISVDQVAAASGKVAAIDVHRRWTSCTIRVSKASWCAGKVHSGPVSRMKHEQIRGFWQTGGCTQNGNLCIPPGGTGGRFKIGSEAFLEKQRDQILFLHPCHLPVCGGEIRD